MAGNTGQVAMWTHASRHQDSERRNKAVVASKLEEDPTLSWNQHQSMAVPGRVQQVACSLDTRCGHLIKHVVWIAFTLASMSPCC